MKYELRYKTVISKCCRFFLSGYFIDLNNNNSYYNSNVLDISQHIYIYIQLISCCSKYFILF